ncbi:unnamed protein product [Amoebophrya sp. A25]|nr:unnamed protein product [Amoebophrya sp. A25]|eukprot:GSA25T00014692001.1
MTTSPPLHEAKGRKRGDSSTGANGAANGSIAANGHHGTMPEAEPGAFASSVKGETPASSSSRNGAIEVAPPVPGGGVSGTALSCQYQAELSIDNTAFFIEAEKPILIKKLVEVLLLQVNEINMEITEEGVSIRGMESSQIALMDVNLSRGNFCTFTVNRPTTIGLQLPLLRDMMKTAGPGDFFRLYKNVEDEYVHMELFPKSSPLMAAHAKLHFSWKSMDIDMEVIQPPDHLCAGEPTIVMESSRFKELMSEFKNLGEQVELALNTDQHGEHHLLWHVSEASRVMDVWVDSRGDGGSGGRRVTINRNGLQNWRKSFGLKHLDIFSRGSTLSNKIKLWLSETHPACFHYDIEEDMNKGWARFWLAPFAETAAVGN